MKWSSVGELDTDDSDGGEADNDVGDDFPHPISKRVRSKVYFSRGIMVTNTFKGWTCDNKEVQRTTDCPNQDIIDKVNSLQSSRIWNAYALPSGYSLLNSWNFTSRN